MWRKLRIAILLLILLFVALNTYFDRVYSTDWDIPLRVAVYSVNGDGTDAADRFIRKLQTEDFAALERFFQEEAGHFGITMERPVRLTLAPQLRELPPILDSNAGMPSVVLWSLRTRYWAWRVPNTPGPPPDIKLFVLYHDPQRSPSLRHSVGLQKGLFGIVNVFADQRMLGSNDTIIAHELLHTLGATDKYDRSTNQPLHPHGYAEADREPRYPQSFAELMAGRIPLTPGESQIPESLQQVVVGAMTATEIGWNRR